MKIVLTEKKIDEKEFPKDVKIYQVTLKSLDNYNMDKNIVAIAGSRAMAKKVAFMNLENIKLFQLTSAGFDGVPCEIFAKKGVAVANAGNVYSAPIAETVVFGMLAMAKRLHNNPNNRHFKIQRHYNMITELLGKSVLIMGAGNIGTAIAYRLWGFEMKIDGYDPYCEEKRPYNRIIRNRKELLSHLNEYDYVISTMPDNNQTKNFVNREFLENMKSVSVIINVGRRAVIDENDLYRALKSKKIDGAVLDIFEKFPNPIKNKFRRLHNVIVLPGVAAISKEVNIRLEQHMTKNILAALNGEIISNVINGVE